MPKWIFQKTSTNQQGDRSKTIPIKRPYINPCPQICKPSDGPDSKKQQKTCKESFSVVCRGEDAIFHDCRITFSEKG